MKYHIDKIFLGRKIALKTLCGLSIRIVKSAYNTSLLATDKRLSIHVDNIAKIENTLDFCPDCLGIYYLEQIK